MVRSAVRGTAGAVRVVMGQQQVEGDYSQANAFCDLDTGVDDHASPLENLRW